MHGPARAAQVRYQQVSVWAHTLCSGAYTESAAPETALHRPRALQSASSTRPEPPAMRLGRCTAQHGPPRSVISKFDGYEQYLYFESTSFAWPKSNNLPPYTNLTGSNPAAISWYNTQLASASLYDELNQSNLVYTVPEFIRQDSSNAPYSLFLNMVGQHFDNIWIYAKAVTDKYNTFCNSK